LRRQSSSSSGVPHERDFAAELSSPPKRIVVFVFVVAEEKSEERVLL